MVIGMVLLFEGFDGLWIQDDWFVDNVVIIILINVKFYIDLFRKLFELGCGWFVFEKMDIE